MSIPDEADIDLDTLYDEFINAAQTAARQALTEEREEHEIAEAQKALLNHLTHN